MRATESLADAVAEQINSLLAAFAAADFTGTTVDVTAVEAFLSVNELCGQLQNLASLASDTKQRMAERLSEQFALLGVQNMHINGSTLYAYRESYANAKGACRRELVEWARGNGLDDLIVLQPQRFKSWCREQIECGNGLPDAIKPLVDIFEKSSVRVRRG